MVDMIFAFKSPRQVRLSGPEGPQKNRRSASVDAAARVHDSDREAADDGVASTASTLVRSGGFDGVAPDPGFRAKILDRSGSNRWLWLVCVLIYAALAVASYALEFPFNPQNTTLLIFFVGASLLSVMVPATGPQGRRIFLLPGMGLAAMLLLPPITANLPLLLANAAYAASRETAASRRVALLRGTWILVATLLSGIAYRIHSTPGHAPSLVDAVIGVLLYCFLYAVGRRTDAAAMAPPTGGGRTFGWYRLECVALLAAAPLAVLMQVMFTHDGMTGLGMSIALYTLIVLIAHYGFEVAMLREQVKAMEKISAVTWSQTSPKRVVDRFMQLSAKLIPCDRTILWLTDHSQTRLEIAAHSPSDDVSIDPQARSIRFGEGLVGRVADHQHPMIVRDGTSDPRLTELDDARRLGLPFSVLLLPLVVAGETIGVAQFERDAPQSYGQRDVSRVQPLASQAAATIANVRAHQDVYNQAVTDALTGLFNRRHMQSVLADERRRAERYGHTLSVVMLDVDGFKSYNDTYGHPQGDILLKQLADILRDNMRNVDIIGRYGGEEFIIVMPETSKDEAFHTAERLRNAVANAVFPGHPGENGTTVRKSISLGVASFPIDTDDPHTLVSKADQALYRAKNAGRNRTILSGQTVAPPAVIVAEGPVAR